MATFTIERQIAASPETVFDVLTDHRRYAEITPLRGAKLEREGSPVPDGTGAIRVLSSLGPPLREEILDYEAPRRFSYRLLSGLPVRDHVGTVELTPQDGGTLMTYAVRSMPTVPIVGFAVIAAAEQGVKVLVRGVAKESERRAAGA